MLTTIETFGINHASTMDTHHREEKNPADLTLGKIKMILHSCEPE